MRNHDEIDRAIRAAIREKTTIRAVYGGSERILCPQMIGRNRENGVRVLCLQIGGASASGLVHKVGAGDWRCLALEQFTRVEPTTLAWQAAGDTLRRPKCIERIELRATD
jgi:hypothetical protein